MSVIDGVFCLHACMIYKRKTLSVVTPDWNETVGSYKTVTVVNDRSTKYVVN